MKNDLVSQVSLFENGQGSYGNSTTNFDKSTNDELNTCVSPHWFIYPPILPQNNISSNVLKPEIRMNSKRVFHKAVFKQNAVSVQKVFEGFDRPKTEAELRNLEKGKDGLYNGYMSPTTLRKVRKILECWLLALEANITDKFSKPTMKPSKATPFFPTFITLTLPAKQTHDDRVIKKELLDRFNDRFLRGKHKVQNYFWRAEVQTNGNIHFHILVDKYIAWGEIRKEWNKLLDKVGYIDAYRNNQLLRHANGFKVCNETLTYHINKERTKFEAQKQTDPKLKNIEFDIRKSKLQGTENQHKAYLKGKESNFSDPNTTDIHAIQKLNNVTAYIVKYCSKNDFKPVIDKKTGEITYQTETRKIEGFIWGCSDGIKELKHYEETICECVNGTDYLLNNEAAQYVQELIKNTAESDKIENDYVTIYKLPKGTPQHSHIKSKYSDLFKKYTSHYTSIYDTLYESS